MLNNPFVLIGALSLFGTIAIVAFYVIEERAIARQRRALIASAISPSLRGAPLPRLLPSTTDRYAIASLVILGSALVWAIYA